MSVFSTHLALSVCVLEAAERPCRQFHTHLHQEEMTKVICKSIICKGGLCFTQESLCPGHTPRVLPHSCVYGCKTQIQFDFLGRLKCFGLCSISLLGTVQVFLDCLTCSQHLRGLLGKCPEGSRRRELGRMSQSSEMFSQSERDEEKRWGRHWRGRRETRFFIDNY